MHEDQSTEQVNGTRHRTEARAEAVALPRRRDGTWEGLHSCAGGKAKDARAEAVALPQHRDVTEEGSLGRKGGRCL